VAAARRPATGSGPWLGLANDGDRAVVVFLGEPWIREVAFVGGRSVPYEAHHHAAGVRPTVRVAINVALYPERHVRVLELALPVFRRVLVLRKEHRLEARAFAILRRGAAGDAGTTYEIEPADALSPEEQQVFAALPLHHLERLCARGPARSAPPQPPHVAPAPLRSPAARPAAPATPPDVVDRTTADALIARLRRLPPEVVQRFGAEFRVTRVRELPARETARAQAFVARLEAEAELVERDPFAEPA
jgi:hypothetical protein